MRSEERLDRRRRWLGWIGSSEGTKEVEKLLTGMCREAVGGVADDIGVDVLCEVEADGEAAWITVRVVVGDKWESS